MDYRSLCVRKTITSCTFNLQPFRKTQHYPDTRNAHPKENASTLQVRATMQNRVWKIRRFVFPLMMLMRMSRGARRCSLFPTRLSTYKCIPVGWTQSWKTCSSLATSCQRSFSHHSLLGSRPPVAEENSWGHEKQPEGSRIPKSALLHIQLVGQIYVHNVLWSSLWIPFLQHWQLAHQRMRL